MQSLDLLVPMGTRADWAGLGRTVERPDHAPGKLSFCQGRAPAEWMVTHPTYRQAAVYGSDSRMASGRAMPIVAGVTEKLVRSALPRRPGSVVSRHAMIGDAACC